MAYKFKIPNDWSLILFAIWKLEFICILVLVICFFRFIQLGSDKINLGAFDTVDRQHQLWRNYAESDR